MNLRLETLMHEEFSRKIYERVYEQATHDSNHAMLSPIGGRIETLKSPISNELQQGQIANTA